MFIKIFALFEHEFCNVTENTQRKKNISERIIGNWLWSMHSVSFGTRSLNVYFSLKQKQQSVLMFAATTWACGFFSCNDFLRLFFYLFFCIHKWTRKQFVSDYIDRNWIHGKTMTMCAPKLLTDFSIFTYVFSWTIYIIERFFIVNCE